MKAPQKIQICIHEILEKLGEWRDSISPISEVYQCFSFGQAVCSPELYAGKVLEMYRNLHVGKNAIYYHVQNLNADQMLYSNFRNVPSVGSAFQFFLAPNNFVARIVWRKLVKSPLRITLFGKTHQGALPVTNRNWIVRCYREKDNDRANIIAVSSMCCVVWTIGRGVAEKVHCTLWTGVTVYSESTDLKSQW